jgi:hypothetical protein
MKRVPPALAWMVRITLMLALLAPITWSQSENAMSVERTFAFPADVVKSALDRVAGSGGGKLPMIDGFVLAAVPDMDRYERPYYQYRVQLLPGDNNNSIVKVEARISAWYSDPDPARSQYRSLPSNGRLENDFLDHLQQVLTPGSSKANGIGKPIPSTIVPAGNPRPDSLTAPDLKPAPPSTKPPATPATPQEQLDAILAQRQDVREKTAAAKARLDNLKSAAQNSSDVAKLAAVKHSGVGVMSRKNFGGPVLFRAQAEDEFEVQSVEAGWAQVRLADGATGYIQSDELVLPAGMQPKPTPETEVAAAPQPGKPADPDLDFWVSREDVNTFSGDWARLKGKKVLFVYAQPRGLLSDMSGNDAKLSYAKRVFMTRFKSVNPAATGVEGVVVVFIGNRGGIAAATLADIQQWVEGGLGDDAFVNRCSLDPLAEFKRIHMN